MAEKKSVQHFQNDKWKRALEGNLVEQDKSALPISDNVNVHCAHHPVNGKRKNKTENLPKIEREKL